MISKRNGFIIPVTPFVLLFLSFVMLTPTVNANDDSLLWNIFKVVRMLWGKCLVESKDSRLGNYNVSVVQRCLFHRTALALDRLRAIDHLQISRGIDLVRYRNDSRSRSFGINHIAESDVDWKSQLLAKLDAILNTRILKIQMKTDDLAIHEGRRRHRRNNYSTMGLLMFSTMAITMIAVPMGFQLLAVLGGKALLLAKMALIMTSIQGLKRIATSNLNYGLYRNGGANPWTGQYDRSWYHTDQHMYHGSDVTDPTLALPNHLSVRNEVI